jgi:hypothetical protein
VQRTSAVNIRKEKCDFYGARPSFLGNPYEIGRDGTRDDVIEKYREWFYKKLMNPTFRDRVLSLRGLRIGCWCKPLPCHLDVVVEYLESQNSP